MVKQWLMPDTEFRSVYAVPGDSDGMTLCAPARPQVANKLAYMWAYRLAECAASGSAVLKEADVPIGMRAGRPVKLEIRATGIFSITSSTGR